MSNEKTPWIAISERKPTKLDADVNCCVLALTNTGPAIWEVSRRWSEPTHWMPIPPPPHEPTQEEKDVAEYAAWYHRAKHSPTLIHDCWFAALAYARKDGAK